MARQSRFGQPMRITPGSSRRTELLIDLTKGLVLTDSPTDLPLGASPDGENFIIRYSSLQKRQTLAARSSQTINPGTPILGGLEVVDVTGNAYPFASYTTRPTFYSAGSWSSPCSYVSAAGINDIPTMSTTSYWDIVQIYYDTQDENCAIMAAQSYQSLYIWKSGATVFSTLSNAPQARFVTGFDSFLLAANIRQGTSDFVQRVAWSDRGSIATWLSNAPTGSLAGYADLLDMQGQITRIVGHDNRVVVTSDREVWAGRRVDFPQSFDFQPLDRTVGCPFSWTLAVTRLGLIWLGKDFNVYLLEKGAAQAIPIGNAIQPELQRYIDAPDRAQATYNRLTDQYELYYPIVGGNGTPQRALYCDLKSGAWMRQSFPTGYGISKVWNGTLGTGSAGSTWAQMQTAGLTWAQVTGSWGAYNAITNNGPLAVYAGLSSGSLCYFDSAGTTDLGAVVTSRWESGAFGGIDPTRSKTLQSVRVDYQADSSSSLSVRVSPDQGASFQQGVSLDLPTSSTESQVRAHTYVNSRYPVVELSTEVGRPVLMRMWVRMQDQGR